MPTRTLVIGAAGQIGTELVNELRKRFGSDAVVAADIRQPETEIWYPGPFEKLDIMDRDRLAEIVKKHKVSEVYHLAALLSASGEKNPHFAWKLNMDGLFNVLELAKEGLIKKVFWPSSIAVFGPNSPKENTPQRTVMEPVTVYGISKVAGESWCEYYHNKFGVDVRSIRYPGLIGYNSPPGGGTTDYAVHIFYEALRNKTYTCFLEEDRALPMMYMEDAIRATIDIMQAPAENIKIRTSYNLSGMSFSPRQIAEAIKKEIPEFTISYAPDFRNEIAAGWPSSIDDNQAQSHWNWKAEYDLEKMVSDMLKNLKAAGSAGN